MKLISMLRGHGAPPDKGVMVEREHTHTRSGLSAGVSRFMEFLREHGVRRGQRVLAVVDHDSRGIALLAAASGLDVHLLMPYNLHAAAVAEWVGIANAAQPDYVVMAKPAGTAVTALGDLGVPLIMLPELDTGPLSAPNLVEPDSDRPVEGFLVLFTSGTTGSPKAISISETTVCQRILSVTEKLSFSSQARIFMSGLLNNTTGVIFSFGALHHDATLILPAHRDVGLWPAEVARHMATHIMLRPVAMRQFVRSLETSPVAVDSLQVVAYGAAAMPRLLLETGRRLIPCQWVQGYGLSETFGPFCWLDEQAHQQRRYRRDGHCVGVPDGTVEVRLESLDGDCTSAGEIAVRSSAIMDGYVDVATNRIARPCEWLRTGDVGEWSTDGDLILKGRLHESILSENGHRIYPEEVEAALAGLPGVDEVALVGVPSDPHLAELPVACVSGSLANRQPHAIRLTVEKALGALSVEKWPGMVYPSPVPFPRNCGDKIMRASLAETLDRAALIPLGSTSDEERSR